MTYYGFSSFVGKPVWFHTEAAALCFRKEACLLSLSIETTEHAEPEDILDSPDEPWKLERAENRIRKAILKSLGQSAVP